MTTAAAPLELLDAQPSFEVLEAEYHRLLGFPRDYPVEGRSRELEAWARGWYREHGRPWWYARRTTHVACTGDGVTIDGATFASSRLRDRLHEARADAAVLLAVSAGPECEAMARTLWEDGKPDEYFFLEVYGSAVVEALVAAASFRLCAWADGHGTAVLPHYSPGYPDWTIADQQKLLDALRGGGASLPGPVAVLESGMLQPKKSLLAVFGLTPHVASVQRLTSLVPCTNCSLPACRYRRAPYQHPIPQLERLGREVEEERAPLTSGARYSLAARTLDKWSRERLTLDVREDGGVAATFRYDGTTCSNMGYPLAFEYRIVLAPREAGYTITDLGCAPASGDDGYTMMCEYLAQGDALMEQLQAERPLLGRPLNDVVTWQRSHTPSGCYCSPEGREHKWGLALEVLHYALARREDLKETA